MKVTIVEGTPEEILSVMPNLKNSDTVIAKAVEAKPSPAEERSEDGERTYISTRVARKVLTRRTLKDKSLNVLKILYKAHPKLVLATELHKQVGYTPAQFAGLMGAFGRRVSHTEGHISGDWFFVTEWNDAQHCYEYGLPDSVREALVLEKMV